MVDEIPGHMRSHDCVSSPQHLPGEQEDVEDGVYNPDDDGTKSQIEEEATSPRLSLCIPHSQLK